MAFTHSGEFLADIGLGLPIATTAARTGYTPSQNGITVYDSDLTKPFIYMGGWLELVTGESIYSGSSALQDDNTIDFNDKTLTFDGSAATDGSLVVNAVLDQQYTSGTVTSAMDSTGVQIYMPVTDSADNQNSYLQINEHTAGLNSVDVASLPTINNSWIKAGSGASTPFFDLRSGNTISGTSAFSRVYGDRNSLELRVTGDSAEVAVIKLETDGTDAFINAATTTTTFVLPSGITGDRMTTPIAGGVRYDSTLGYAQIYQNGRYEKIGQGEQVVELLAYDYATDQAAATGLVHYYVPAKLVGWELSEVIVINGDADGVGGTSTWDVNINGASTMTTTVTVDAAEKSSNTAATPPVVAANTLALLDDISIDCDAVHSTTAAQGATVMLVFSAK